MSRSTVDDWLSGPGDLAEAVIEDAPVPGKSVKVRALSARYSADVQSQMKLVQQGSEQVAKIDVPAMELLQFVHGVVEPQFTDDQARQVQEKYGPGFRKVIAKIDEISGIDKAAIEETEARFPAGGETPAGDRGVDGTPSGDGRPDVPVRAGAGAGEVGE